MNRKYLILIGMIEAKLQLEDKRKAKESADINLDMSGFS
jgi:hypothetical protein